MVAPAQREHEGLEDKLRTLMVQDAKARERHDKLAAELHMVDEELKQIAKDKMDISAQLAGLYKKYANGNGRKKEAA